MNYKYMLSLFLCLTLTACHEEIKSPKSEEIILYDNPTAGRLERKLRGEYLFGKTYRGEVVPLSGTLTDAGKNLIRNIWGKLQAEGFSGYDPESLNQEIVIQSDTSWENQEKRLNFHENFLYYSENAFTLIEKLEESLKGKNQYLGILSSLTGLKFNNKFVYIYRNGSEVWRLGIGKTFLPTLNLSETEPDWNNLQPGEVVDLDTLLKWNQLFMDAFKEDPYLKKFIENPWVSKDETGWVSTIDSRTGSTGGDAINLKLNGTSIGQVFALPFYAKLQGSVDHHFTDVKGLISNRFGNTTLGTLNTYSDVNNVHYESSLLLSNSFGGFFVEGQLGFVSDKLSGYRSQLTLGFDSRFGSPFVQVLHRDFGSFTETTGFVGVETLTKTLQADAYTVANRLYAKVGANSKSDFKGYVNWEASLSLNNGINLNTDLAFGLEESNLSFSFDVVR